MYHLREPCQKKENSYGKAKVNHRPRSNETRCIFHRTIICFVSRRLLSSFSRTIMTQSLRQWWYGNVTVLYYFDETMDSNDNENRCDGPSSYVVLKSHNDSVSLVLGRRRITINAIRYITVCRINFVVLCQNYYSCDFLNNFCSRMFY